MPCTLDKLDKEWSLKFKSMTVKDSADNFKNPAKELRITLEFTKDVAEVKPIRKAFESSFAFERTPAKDRPPHVLFYMFDEDNVAITKVPLTFPEGEITGKSGDAFRAVVRVHPETFKKVKKIEIRMSEKE